MSGRAEAPGDSFVRLPSLFGGERVEDECE